jgi:hypothetical protein
MVVSQSEGKVGRLSKSEVALERRVMVAPESTVNDSDASSPGG